jgi:hypothetical protein
VTFSLSNFYTPYEKSSASGGTGNGLFAIFDGDGKKVWPAGEEWYTITHDTSHADLNASLAEAKIWIEKGDTLYFVGKRAGAEATSFAAVPVVYYLAADGYVPPSGNGGQNETGSDDIGDIFN